MDELYEFDQPKNPVRKIIGIILVILIVLAVAFFIFIKPLVRGWQLHDQLMAALDHAASVVVVEHSSRFDHPLDANYQEVTLATVTLRANQIETLRQALPITTDTGEPVDVNSLFIEHHTIQITEQDGSVLTLHLSLHSAEMALNDGSPRIMPDGWSDSLGTFLTSVNLHPNGPWDKR